MRLSKEQRDSFREDPQRLIGTCWRVQPDGGYTLYTWVVAIQDDRAVLSTLFGLPFRQWRVPLVELVGEFCKFEYDGIASEMSWIITGTWVFFEGRNDPYWDGAWRIQAIGWPGTVSFEHRGFLPNPYGKCQTLGDVSRARQATPEEIELAQRLVQQQNAEYQAQENARLVNPPTEVRGTSEPEPPTLWEHIGAEG